jgi:hypothetical protein
MRRIAWITILLCIVVAGNAHAVPFEFTAITGNDSLSGGSLTNYQIGEAQLLVDVTDAGISDAGVNQVLFTFTNTGPDASSITDIYFDDGTLLGIAMIDDSDPNVDFQEGARPSRLSGGMSMANPFITTVEFNSSSVAPPVPNGVNPGESVGITFDLILGKTFSDTLAYLDNGMLRIGLKVGGFADGGSESFVNVPQPVPEPSTALGLGTFVMVAYGFARRRRPRRA